MHRTWGRASALLVVVLLLGAAVTLQAVRDRRYPEGLSTDREVLYVTSGEAVKRLALSYEAILADVYWIRAVQHFGGQRLAEPHTRRYDLLYPLLDITTTLDPYFNIAYRFGAIFLSEGYPDGPARPDLAIALLQKGHDQRPDRWQYLHDIAFIHYWWLQDYRGAAQWFRRAGDVPGAPEWLEGLAATALARGHDREASRELWTRIRDHAEQDYMRRTAEFRLEQLSVMDEIDYLDTLLARVSAASGAPVTSWEPLVGRRLLRHAPVDPSGAPYVIDPRTGRAALSPQSRYFPLPDEPPRAVGLPAGESLSRER